MFETAMHKLLTLSENRTLYESVIEIVVLNREIVFL